MCRIWMLSILISTVSALGAETNPAYIHAAAGGRTWQLGNSLVEREIRFAPNHGLYTENWVHKVTGTDFLREKLPAEAKWKTESMWRVEFEFYAGKDRLQGATPGPEADFEFVDSEIRDIAPSGKLLAVHLRAKKKAIEVTSYYAVYTGHPVIRKWIAITNRGDQEVVLNQLVFELQDLQAAPPSEQLQRYYYGNFPREVFFAGRIDDPAIVSTNPRTGEGYVVMNEAPSWMKRTYMVNFGEGVQVGYDTELWPFKRPLKPGETFSSAASDVAFFVDGRGFADPRWVMPSFTSAVLLKKGAAFRAPWFYNTWDPFTSRYSDALVRELIPIAADMGFDIFTLDTGWSENYSDIKVHAEKFPQGLDGVRGEMESRGMGLGMWYPINSVGPKGTPYLEHPEWVMRDEEGRERVLQFPEEPTRFFCLNSPFREWAAEHLASLIRQQRPKYIKIDLTVVGDAYGRWLGGCSAPGHYHRNREESLQGIFEGLQYVTDRVYREFPDVLLDITYETWAQIHAIDYGLMHMADMDWMSNVNDQSVEQAGPRNARTLLYHRSLAIPTEAMLIGNLISNIPPREEHFATAMGSAPVMLGDLRKVPPDDVKWFGEKIRWFKELRKQVPMNEGFFPLGSWQQPSVTAWDGYARLSRKGEGVIVLFKNDSGVSMVEVKLPVFPSGKFTVRSVITGKSLGKLSGEKMRRGIAIPLPASSKVEILEVRAL
jgi:alpha-galactosidase